MQPIFEDMLTMSATDVAMLFFLAKIVYKFIDTKHTICLLVAAN